MCSIFTGNVLHVLLVTCHQSNFEFSSCSYTSQFIFIRSPNWIVVVNFVAIEFIHIWWIQSSMQNPYIGIFLLTSTFWCCKSFVNTFVSTTIDFQTSNSLCRRGWGIDNSSTSMYYIRFCPFLFEIQFTTRSPYSEVILNFPNKFITFVSRDI